MWMNVGGDVLNCYRSWQHQLPNHCIHV